MTQQQQKSRQKKSQLLEVKHLDPTTYLVQSQSDPLMFYKVVLNGSNSCHCADFKRNREQDPTWTCKHIAAALDLKANVERVEARANGQANGANGKLSPQEKERLNLEVAAMFGDQAAVDKLNAVNRAAKAGGSLQIQPLASAETEETFEAEPREACSECGQLLPASEMIPWQAPNGSGLICPECYQAHKEIQSELKERSEETPAEPGILPQPAAHCALCGGEFPLAGDPSLSCKNCELKAQERTSSPRRDTLPKPQDNHGSMDPPSGIPTEIPEPEEEIPAGEEAVQLESCLVCHTKAPADEMILVSGVSGTGLVCHTCYDGRRACGSCGARLPLEELAHFEAEFGPVTLCCRCALSREWDEKEKAKSPASTTPTLDDRIARANQVLASFGNAAIEKVAVKNRNGQVVKELFGYGLQYTLDAVNAALGPDAWRYKLLEWRAIEGGKGALVLVELELWDGSRCHSHGPMFGTTALSDEGDGLKGAIGDALKKSFAYWGIGNLAYRGELKAARA